MKYVPSKLYLCVCFILLLCAVIGCSGKKAEPVSAAAEPEITGYNMHNWYYFTKTGFSQIDAPQNVPETAVKPWTEAIRIASAGTSGSKGFAVVNRFGIIDFSSGKPLMIRDTNVFSGVTADRLLFLDGEPVFHLYRNTYFNTEILPVPAISRPLLVRFDADSAVCFPVLTDEDIGIAANQEITSISLSDGEWVCAVKKTEADRITFSYMKFSSPVGIGAIPDERSAPLTITEIDADGFRKTQKPRDFSEAPEKLKILFEAVPDTFPFYLSCRTADNMSPVLYDRTGDGLGKEGYTAQGYAQVTERVSVAIFSDGTTYLSVLRNNTEQNVSPVTAFRLPKLPAGFVYGEFVICNNKLYVAWEESDFYKTGRSGFIEVDLYKLLSGIL